MAIGVIAAGVNLNLRYSLHGLDQNQHIPPIAVTPCSPTPESKIYWLSYFM
jgi:hypothetical protein